MTIEQLLDQADLVGYHLNNLFQRRDGSWQANFRFNDKLEECGGFGHGKTPQEALRRALECVPPIRQEPNPYAPPPPPTKGVFD